jgi:predicted nucleotidyltransferase
MAEPTLDMPLEHRRIVDDILDAYASKHEVWAFGSRARGGAKPYSDLDLAVIGDAHLNIEQLAALADAFEESDLPWRVDIVDWATTDAAFRRIIERDKIVLHRA